MTTRINRAAIERTYGLITPYIRVTPVVETSGADFGLGAFALALKLELFQHAGSFKTRGAFTNLLTRAIPAAGVVAASGGNHGAAVAYAAMRLGVKARIFVPTVSSPAKISRIRGYGADLVVTGDRYADALAASQVWTVESGALPVHAFDQEETLLGQGTLALELGRQAPGPGHRPRLGGRRRPHRRSRRIRCAHRNRGAVGAALPDPDVLAASLHRLADHAMAHRQGHDLRFSETRCTEDFLT